MSHTHAAPPPFAMPMFRSFVPEKLRPWIYVLQAFCFQFSGGVYLGAMSERVGEHALMREDIQMCLYSTLAGMALYFPLLFRMKFRFTNKQLLVASALVILGGNILTVFSLPLPLLWLICFVCGMAKIQGTFENMSNIQLWMTPRRDFAVFFPLLHIILLTSIEVSGYLAAAFAFYAHWELMHWLVCGLMLFVLLVQTTLCRPFRPMPNIVPLRGIDWTGALLWALMSLQVVGLLCYGNWLDWWNSPITRLLSGTSLITLAVCLHRMFTHPQPYIEPRMWTYRYAVAIILLIGVVEAIISVENVLETTYCHGVMHYDDLRYEALCQWSLPGVWAGCLFSLGWLKLMRWNAYKLIAVGLLALAVYQIGFYHLMASHINIELLRLPIAMRGFGCALLSIALMWCLHEVMSFEHFFQSLAIFNILHMYVGGALGGALLAHGIDHYMADGVARTAGYFTHAATSAMPFSPAETLGAWSEALLAQSLKTLYGWIIYITLFFALLMLLWDIPVVRRRVKHIPTWPLVGLRQARKAHRWQKLQRIKRQRRNGMALPKEFSL